MIRQKFGKAHAEKLLASYGGGRNLGNMKCLVDDMAEFYGTTKTMARKRLIDFGFTEARGIMQSVDGKLVPSYISDLKDNETYSVSEAEGIREYLRNKEFRRVIDTGLYAYVEGHYCLDSPEYIFTDRYGFRHLRPEAWENMSACCLVFKITFENVFSSDNDKEEIILFQSISLEESEDDIDENGVVYEEKHPSPREAKARHKYICEHIGEFVS